RVCVEPFFYDHTLLYGVLGINDGTFTRHGDRFLERTNFHLDVDWRSEVAGQLDAVTANGSEPRQRERHRVHAWTQIDDLVRPLIVGDRGARLFDQHGTARFNRHAWQNIFRRI